MTGLLHDCDYEEFPDLHEHTQVAARWLHEAGFDDRIIYAILAHNDLNLSEQPRTSLLAKALYACDEVTGMITAQPLLSNATQEDWHLSFQDSSPCLAWPHNKNTQPPLNGWLRIFMPFARESNFS